MLNVTMYTPSIVVCSRSLTIHGGMGITGEYPIMRHTMNLESVITTKVHDIRLLITGMDITGENALPDKEKKLKH